MNFAGPLHPSELAKEMLHEQEREREEEHRKLADAQADREAVWALADFYLPPSVKEMAASWGMKETLTEIWRGAFIEGWRAAHRNGKPE